MLIIVYLIYTVIYLFNVNHTYYILPNNFNFLSTFTEFKTILNLFSRGLTLFLNLFVKFNLVWKPLFRKSSYYGLYRSNRNQWLNK